MGLFALRDANDPDGSVLAVLTYHTHEREFYFDMPAGTDPWSVPLILSTFAARGEWAVGPQWARRWVESRVVPPNRQNLGEVLKANGLNEYDELALLEMTNPTCTTESRSATDGLKMPRKGGAGDRAGRGFHLNRRRARIFFQLTYNPLAPLGPFLVSTAKREW